MVRAVQPCLKLIGAALLAGIGLAPAQAAAPAATNFEVASIKPAASCGEGRNGPRLGITSSPGRLIIRCQTVDFLIRQAYLANGRDPLFIGSWLFQQPIRGGPAWSTSTLYSIEAKAEGVPSRETMLGSMMRGLLENRFKLKVHRETRAVPVYELTVANGGPRLEPAKQGGCVPLDLENMDPPPGKHSCGIPIRSLKGSGPAIAFYGATLADVSRGIASFVGREVVDKTGVAGAFDVRMEISPADLFPGSGGRGLTDPDATPGPSIFDAIHKLGLNLESGKASREFLVIDHVEKPDGN